MKVLAWFIGLAGLVGYTIASPISPEAGFIPNSATFSPGSTSAKRAIGTVCGPVEGSGVPSPNFDLTSIYQNTYTLQPHACLNVLCQPGTSTNVFLCSDSNASVNVPGSAVFRAVNDIIDNCAKPGRFLTGTSTWDGYHIQIKRAGWCG